MLFFFSFHPCSLCLSPSLQLWSSSDCPPLVPGSPWWRPTLQPCPQTQSLMRSTRPRRLTPKAQGKHTLIQRKGRRAQAQKASSHMHNRPDMQSTHVNMQTDMINAEAGGCTHWHTYTRTGTVSKALVRTDPLLLPGTAARYRIRHVTAPSEINPAPDRYSHFSVHT